MVPAAVGLCILGTPIVRLAFERGAYGSEDTALTVFALTFYTVGLLWAAWRQLLNKTFYALQDT